MLTTKLTAIADAIRAKTGEAGTMTLAEMPTKISGISSIENVEWHQCPELVRNYLANVTYDPSDYSTSQIADYAPATAVESNYRPAGVTVGGNTYYNQMPNTETPFANSTRAGTLKPLDQVRWIKTTAANVRDLGGWACDGGTVKYGLLFRGGYLSATDRTVLVDELGIMHDLDLRGTAEAGITASPLGNDVHYTCATNYVWYTMSYRTEAWKTNLRTVFDAVAHGAPVYFHCTMGADRTATLACVLEGLLGVSQSDIDKDYELTDFYSGTDTDSNARRRNETDWTGLINQINAKTGDTFRDKCVSFAAELGFTADEVNAYRAAMIDGTPETLSFETTKYTISQSLSNATSSNTIVSVQSDKPFETTITPSGNYVIGNIKITMGGTNITDKVWQGEKTNLKFAVSYSLTGCSVDNQRATVIKEQSYAAHVTADDGYKMDGATATITMGGVDVSAYYSDGKITIPNVTGDVVITITAVESATEPDPINQIPISTDADGNVYNSAGYKVGYRIKSNGSEVELAGCVITGFIPAKVGDVVRANKVGALSANGGMYFYDSSHSMLGRYVAYYQNSDGILGEGDGTSIGKSLVYTIPSTQYDGTSSSNVDIAQTAFIRMGFADIGSFASTLFVTINEELPE